jgi:hypothetical protein
MEEKLKQELEKLVDVCVGKMTLKEINNELLYYMRKSPELLIITIEGSEIDGRYYSTVYLTPKDFNEKC